MKLIDVLRRDAVPTISQSWPRYAKHFDVGVSAEKAVAELEAMGLDQLTAKVVWGHLGESSKKWLTTPHSALDQIRPIDLALLGDEDVLKAFLMRFP